MYKNFMNLTSSKIYDRQLLIKSTYRDNQLSIESSLSENQKKEKMLIVFEVGKVKGRVKTISREEHEAFLALAYLGDARILANIYIMGSVDFNLKQQEAKKCFNAPDFEFIYDYCFKLLRRKHWTTNEICSDFRIEK